MGGQANNNKMHTIEPHYGWRHLYIASEDARSPFYGDESNEFLCIDSIYDHYIHPQWDNIGSATLYLKILFTDYERGFCIIELMGEWNDTLYNDIMYLKRNIADALENKGINKYILVGENVMNFHSGDKDYYDEWFDDVEEGWIACVNFREHVQQEFEQAHIDYYVAIGGTLNNLIWRSLEPLQFFENVELLIRKRLPV